MENAELVRSEASGVAAELKSLVTWSVVNATAEVNDLRLISLDTNWVSREEVYLPSLEVVNWVFDVI